MAKTRLSLIGFIDPKFRTSSVHTLIATDLIILNDNGATLKFKAPESLIGKEVQVYLEYDGFFYAEALTDIAEAKKLRDENDRIKKEEQINKANRQREIAREQHLKFSKLPFKYYVGIKDTISGLSASGWGDGRSNSTVNHITLSEDINLGKLKRVEHQFLCTIDSGKRWSGQVKETLIDGDGKEYDPKITCVKCLKLAERLIKEE